MRFLATCGLAFALAALGGCGAPTQSAGDVSNLFSDPPAPLETKETTVCTDLGKRTDAPTTAGMTINLDGCKDSALSAQNYKSITSFSFSDLPVTNATAPTADAVHKAIRSQLWLNRSFISLANSLIGIMTKNKDKDATGVVSLPDSATKALANLAKPTITITKNPNFDIANVEFSMAANMAVAGVIKVNLDLQMNGKLVDDAFAVTMKSTSTPTYDKSLIKDLQAVIIIIPYADDVYLDMFVDLTMYTTGVQAIVDNQLNTFLSTSLKGVIDSIMAL